MTPYVIGAVLATAVGAMGTVVGLDRQRAYYTAITIVVASYYVLFAVMGGSTSTLVVEAAVALLFAAGALVGFLRDPRILAFLLLAHGVFDVVHGGLIDNAGLPAFWPPFCIGYDVVAGVYYGVVLQRRAPGDR